MKSPVQGAARAARPWGPRAPHGLLADGVRHETTGAGRCARPAQKGGPRAQHGLFTDGVRHERAP